MLVSHSAIMAFADNEAFDHRYDIFCITDPDIQRCPMRPEKIGGSQMSR
jgi:hypothetical protein